MGLIKQGWWICFFTYSSSIFTNPDWNDLRDNIIQCNPDLVEDKLIELNQNWGPGKLIPFLNQQDDLEQTLLHYAAIHGDAKTIALLAYSQADLEIKNIEGFTPLALAIIHGHRQEVEFLWRFGAKIDSHFAALAQQHGQTEIVDYILCLLDPFRTIENFVEGSSLETSLNRIKEAHMFNEEWSLYERDRQQYLSPKRKNGRLWFVGAVFVCTLFFMHKE